MARFVLNQTIETAEPTIAVDPGLPPGRHRFELVVIDDAGKRSQPVEAIVEIQREIVPPPPVIRTDPRAGAVRPPVDPTLGPTLGASVAPPRFAHSGGEPPGTPDLDPAPARRKRSRKPHKPPAKKPRRPRRKE
jgi:hypothetical protein